MSATVPMEGRIIREANTIDRRPATADDLDSVIRYFQSQNIPVWLHGGWGVEAILGEPLPHDDIDVFAMKRDQQRVRELMAGAKQLMQEFPNRLVTHFDHVKVDIAFVSPWRKRRLLLVHPQAIWIFPERSFGDEMGTIHGKQYPMVSPYITYMEQSHTVWRKKQYREKFRKRVEALDKVMAPEEIEESRRWWPVKNTTWNRLRLMIPRQT